MITPQHVESKSYSKQEIMLVLSEFVLYRVAFLARSKSQLKEFNTFKE